MSAPKPRITKDPMFLLLRDGKVAEFNARRAAGETVDLRKCNFRGVDLRELEADGLDLTDGYFRGADLRGVDLRGAILHGASLAQAHVSGTYFPAKIAAQEIMMSVKFGTRLRY